MFTVEEDVVDQALMAFLRRATQANSYFWSTIQTESLFETAQGGNEIKSFLAADELIVVSQGVSYCGGDSWRRARVESGEQNLRFGGFVEMAYAGKLVRRPAVPPPLDGGMVGRVRRMRQSEETPGGSITSSQALDLAAPPLTYSPVASSQAATQSTWTSRKPCGVDPRQRP